METQKTNKLAIVISIVVLLLIFVLLILSRPYKSYKNPIESNIKDFHFQVGSGWTGYQLNVNSKDNSIMLSHQLYDNKGTVYESSNVIDVDGLTELEEIVNKNEVYTWNGYNKTANDVADGEGFALNIEYENGATILAQGYMYFPNHYIEFEDDLVTWIERYLEVE